MTDGNSGNASARYVAGERIGEGGVAAVYSAWDARLERRVAIKRLSAAPGLTVEETEARVRREANTLAALQHPNIVTVHDIGSDEDGSFVVMEFIEGETLEAAVAHAPFVLESFLSLATQSLAGLGAAHKAGLLHRDIKPRNLMLAWPPDGDFQVKILDFGLAKYAPLPSEQTLDHNDTLLGSIHSMAPEQFRRQPLDARTDLYSLGCVFYYTLTGYYPFMGETVPEVMTAHLEHRLYDLAPIRPDLPSVLCDWVMSLMNVDPADRPRDAVEALAGMRAAVRRNTAAVAPLPLVSPAFASASAPDAAAGRRWGRLALVVSGVVLALIVGGVAIRSSLVSASRIPVPGPGTVPPSTQAQGPALPIVTVAAASAPAAPVPLLTASAAASPTASVVSPAASAAPTAAAAAAAAPTPAGTSESAPILAANDLPALRANLDKPAEVRGTVTGAGQSKSGTVLYLNFSLHPHEALALVFFARGGRGAAASPEGSHPISLDELMPFVGKSVHVRGVISDYKGDVQMVVPSTDQIHVD